jgi:DNA-binding MarR family transcriptional regulator
MMNKYDHMIDRYEHRFFDKNLEPFGLSGPVGVYLMKIYCHRSMRMNALIGDTMFHKSHATRAIAQLAELGYVIKTVDPEDARGYVLTITERGKTVAMKVSETARAWETLVNSALSEEEIKTMNSISEKVYQKVLEYFAEDPINEKDL